jgi:GH24 family phage-related lysozyme (muramidase)
MPVNRIAPTARGRAAIASITALAIGGIVAVFPGQTPVHDDVALAIKTLVVPWEGQRLRAYLDTLPVPHVWTICAGDTNNVRKGMVETPAGCDRRLAVKIERDYRAHLVACISNWAATPIAWRAMMDSLAWNIGWAGACKSTAAEDGRKGDYLASCKAATRYNQSGGRVVIGLVYRREMGDATRIGEAELCVSGL